MAFKKREVPQPKEETKKMGFISEDLDDVEESKAAPEGEYDLRIVSAVDKPSKKETPMITVGLKIEDPDVDAPLVRYYLIGWDRDTPEDQVRMRKLEAKRFQECFDAPSGFEADDLIGLTGRSFVNQEEGQDGNIYNRLRLPRLKG
jgi:hypothetical protein